MLLLLLLMLLLYLNLKNPKHLIFSKTGKKSKSIKFEFRATGNLSRNGNAQKMVQKSGTTKVVA